MSLQVIDPLLGNRWDELVARHPLASAFHQRGWLEALVLTYGYEPLMVTSAAEGEALRDGIVLCRVSSWLTGTRLVSLPFADHCEPLVSDTGMAREFIDWLRAQCERQRLKYVELRPLLPVQIQGYGLRPAQSYYFHDLDLSSSLEAIFGGFHKNCIQRKIRRAEREGLSYEVGRSQHLVDEFYGLLLITRRRHRLLPQPRAWFTNLVDRVGTGLEIRLARKNGAPVAAMLTLRHRSTVVYKYGCSNQKSHRFGGMPFLFWRLIEESKAQGAEKIDFGRSDLNQPGLIAFKEKFGASRKMITYYRHPNPARGVAALQWGAEAMRHFASFLPDAVFSAAGRVLYRHMG